MRREEAEAELETVWRLTGDQKKVWQTCTRSGFPHGALCPACQGDGFIRALTSDGRPSPGPVRQRDRCSTCEWRGTLWGDPNQPGLKFDGE